MLQEDELRAQARSFEQNGDLASAIKCLSGLSQLNTGCNLADVSWLGCCLMEAGQVGEAQLVLEMAEESANEVSKGRLLLWNQLGICYKRLGNFMKAGAYFMKASDVEVNKIC